jgi:hypothetical protein
MARTWPTSWPTSDRGAGAEGGLGQAEAGRDAATATAEAEKLATREVVDLLKAQLAEARKPALVRLLEVFRRR